MKPTCVYTDNVDKEVGLADIITFDFNITGDQYVMQLNRITGAIGTSLSTVLSGIHDSPFI